MRIFLFVLFGVQCVLLLYLGLHYLSKCDSMKQEYIELDSRYWSCKNYDLFDECIDWRRP